MLRYYHLKINEKRGHLRQREDKCVLDTKRGRVCVHTEDVCYLQREDVCVQREDVCYPTKRGRVCTYRGRVLPYKERTCVYIEDVCEHTEDVCKEDVTVHTCTTYIRITSVIRSY